MAVRLRPLAPERRRVADPWLFVMLNPSDADEYNDDPTIRRCRWFAQREGAPYFDVGNLYGYRATDPRELLVAEDPVGPDNDAVLLDAMRRRARIVVAWGANPAAARRLDAFRRLHVEAGRPPLWCLGRTKGGAPRHPLFVRSDERLVPWFFDEAKGGGA